jgi:hypothetical protein
MLMNRPLLMLVAALGAGSSSAFMPSSPASRTTAFVATSSLSMTTEDATDVETARVPKAISAPPKNMPETLPVPVSFDEMVRQASTAMADAYEAGITRQMMRVLLPRDPTAANLGTYFESDADVDTQELILAPPDETWQGGIMQLYRACAPTVLELLRQFSARNNGGNAGVPPRMVEDRSMDESGVDGVGLWMSVVSCSHRKRQCLPLRELRIKPVNGWSHWSIPSGAMSMTRWIRRRVKIMPLECLRPFWEARVIP